MLELDTSALLYEATVDGRRKAYVTLAKHLPTPQVGDVVVIRKLCPNDGTVLERAFARITFVDPQTIGGVDLFVISLEVRLSTGSSQRMKAIKLP